MIDYRIDRKAQVAPGVVPGAFTVIREFATIEAGVQIGPGCYVAPYVTIGAGADIGPHAVILANVPAGAVVGPNVVWDGESEQGARDVLEPSFPLPYKRGRPRKAVQA
jgi:UDP-3-O-[3-hydroxymyristoyl] glucosamine N-acyltransferase